MSESVPVSGEIPSPAETPVRQELSSLVHFNVTRLVETPPEVEAKTLAAISTVWEGYVGRVPTSVQVTFADRCYLPTNNGYVEVSSAYIPDEDRICLGLDTLREMPSERPLEQLAVIYAGHEARHKVQVFQGDTPPGSGESISNGTYHNSRHEFEACEAGIAAFTILYPGEPLTLQLGSYIFTNQQSLNR